VVGDGHRERSRIGDDRGENITVSPSAAAIGRQLFFISSKSPDTGKRALRSPPQPVFYVRVRKIGSRKIVSREQMQVPF